MTAQPRQEFDPSSLIALVSGLGAQAKLHLGLMENPFTHKTEPVDLTKAQTFVNTLEMLRVKTKGNLSPEEDQFLTMILTDLKLRFTEMAAPHKDEP